MQVETAEEFLICVVRLKEKIQKVYNKYDNLAQKATPKEHSPFTQDNSLVTSLSTQGKIITN